MFPFFFLIKQTQRALVMCATDWSLIGKKQSLYAIHQHSERRIDIHCKVTFGFMHMYTFYEYLEYIHISIAMTKSCDFAGSVMIWLMSYVLFCSSLRILRMSFSDSHCSVIDCTPMGPDVSSRLVQTCGSSIRLLAKHSVA